MTQTINQVKEKLFNYARRFHPEISISEWTLDSTEYADKSFKLEYYHITPSFDKIRIFTDKNKGKFFIIHKIENEYEKVLEELS